MDPFKSPCCDSDITTTQGIAMQSHCSKCNASLQWALRCDDWAKWEACAVFNGYDGKLYFAWQVVSNLPAVKRLLDGGQEFVCFSEGIKSSLTGERNTWGDLISRDDHKAFIQRWMDKVVNPEVGTIILKE